MTAPKMSFDTDYGRFYRHPSRRKASSAFGNILPDNDDDPRGPKASVTNIIKMMDEGFLPGYHGKLIAEYAVENLADIAELAEASGSKAAVDKLRAVPDEPHPNSAIGTNVHAAIDALHKGEPIPELNTITAIRMFAQYRYFLEQEKPEILRTEFTVWSYEHKFAGTGDIAWRRRGIPEIVDFKSGTRIWPKVGMQNAAIMNADAVFNDDGGEEEMFNAVNLGVVHIRPMSIKLYQLERVEECWQAFLACKTLFDFARFHKDRVIPAEPLVKTEWRVGKK